MWGASPDGAHPWLHAKPLDAAIGQVPMPYCPGGRHCQRFWMKQKNTNKTQLLPSFLMVDRHKKAKQFWDPKRTLYSCHWCNKLHTNVKHHYLSWRAKLHFDLSNVVNGQKFKKLLTLNEAKKTCGPNMAIAVKLLRFGGKPFFPQNGAGPLKKGAMTPLSRKKGVPTKKYIPKCTDQVCLRYRFGKYQGIPTEYRPKIPNQYTALDVTV